MGLLLNLKRVKASARLEMAKAFGLATSGTPREIGFTMIEAGMDEARVDRIVKRMQSEQEQAKHGP